MLYTVIKVIITAIITVIFYLNVPAGPTLDICIYSAGVLIVHGTIVHKQKRPSSV